MIHYSPESYDNKGLLKLPFLFWLILMLQARTWIVLVIAGASKQQGEALLSLFYPDPQGFYAGLALGLMATGAFLLTGHRQRFPRLWAGCRRGLIFTALLMAALQMSQFSGSQLQQSPLPLILLIFDLLSAYWLVADRRIKDCFTPESAAEE